MTDWKQTAEAARKADEEHVKALPPQLRYVCVTCGRPTLPRKPDDPA